jgi:hypothetical protein
MRLLLTAIFLLTATQAFSEIRQAVCTVTFSKKLNFHSSNSNWSPPVAVPIGTRMTIQYDEDTVVLTHDTPRGFSREEFTVIYKGIGSLRSVNAQEFSTKILTVNDPHCAWSRGVGTYKGEHRDISIYEVGHHAKLTTASCPCANLD